MIRQESINLYTKLREFLNINSVNEIKTFSHELDENYSVLLIQDRISYHFNPDNPLTLPLLAIVALQGSLTHVTALCEEYNLYSNLEIMQLAMFYASYAGNLDIVQYLSQFISPHKYDSAVNYAVSGGHIDVFLFLISFQDVKYRAVNNKMTLLSSIIGGYLDIVDYLLQNQSIINLINSDVFFNRAVHYERHEIVKKLLNIPKVFKMAADTLEIVLIAENAEDVEIINRRLFYMNAFAIQKSREILTEKLHNVSYEVDILLCLYMLKNIILQNNNDNQELIDALLALLYKSDLIDIVRENYTEEQKELFAVAIAMNNKKFMFDLYSIASMRELIKEKNFFDCVQLQQLCTHVDAISSYISILKLIRNAQYSSYNFKKIFFLPIFFLHSPELLMGIMSYLTPFTSKILIEDTKSTLINLALKDTSDELINNEIAQKLGGIQC